MPRRPDVPYFNHRPGHSEEWKQSAVCNLVGTTDPWHAIGASSKRIRKLGKTICLELCPVRMDCLAYALSANIEYGTWGGLDEAERERLSACEVSRVIDTYRMKLYERVEFVPKKERRMVTVLVKVNFVPHLRPGETGEVEDSLARAAIRNGYAEIVGNPENFDEWMYGDEELRLVSGKPKPAKAPAKKAPAKKAPAKARAAAAAEPAPSGAGTETMVAETTPLEAAEAPAGIADIDPADVVEVKDAPDAEADTET